MAKYTVRGLTLINYMKDLRAALNKAQADDDIVWNGTEKNTGLQINVPLRIVGSGARMKVPEHQTGIVMNGSGNFMMSNVHFSCKQICNAIQILDWDGNIKFDNIKSDYNTRHLEKAYPTITGSNIARTNIAINSSEVWSAVLNKPISVVLTNDLFDGHSYFASKNMYIDNSKLLTEFSIDSDKYSITDCSADNLTISGNGILKNVHISKKLSISGDTEIDELHFDQPKIKVFLKNGTFTIKNTDLSNVILMTEDAEIVVKDNTLLPKDAIKNNSQISNQTENESSSKSLYELNSLIGLTSVKQVIQKYINAARVEKAREHENLATSDMSLSMVLAGSPGTGKTTVAKLIGKILFEQGIMPTSKFVHVGRKDLISNHVGETAIRTGNKIKEAIGGVLFIDEAYSLLPSDDSKDWGNEAINTLTDDLEERHNDLIVILAGYTDKMKEFFDRANPGLKSRFSTWVEFPDYTTKELYLIAQMKLEKQFILSNEVKAYVYKAIENFKNSGVAEGNGRFVRIFTQEITFAQSNRITEAGTFDRKSLETLLPEDINEAYKNLGEQIVARR